MVAMLHINTLQCSEYPWLSEIACILHRATTTLVFLLHEETVNGDRVKQSSDKIDHACCLPRLHLLTILAEREDEGAHQEEDGSDCNCCILDQTMLLLTDNLLKVAVLQDD